MTIMGTPAICRLTRDSDDPNLFTASAPGAVNLKLVSNVGNIAFLLQNTDVLDSSGKSINPTKTPTALTFNVTEGDTFIVETLYFIFPTHSVGVLQEDCANGVVLSPISAIQNPQQFTIKGVKP